MSRSDMLSDVLTRIRNAQKVGDPFVVAPSSNFVKDVLAVMKSEGYIKSFAEFLDTDDKSSKNGIIKLKIDLKYYEGEPVIEEVKRVSKPGKRVYSNIKDLKAKYGGLATIVLSTSKGVISDVDAKKMKVGGEVLFYVF